MNLRKRLVFFGGLTLLLMVLSGCGPHYGAWSDKARPDFVFRRLDSQVEDLNLTPVQKEKYCELRASLKTHFSEAQEDRRKFKETFRAEIAKDTPDVADLTETMKKKIEDVSTIMRSDLDLLAAFYGSLDNTQKQKVVTVIRERMNRRCPCGEESK
ncbi:MAG: Spy/CpxP family protein refolding chaperone [Thermodesulfobacteriota bacterium]